MKTYNITVNGTTYAVQVEEVSTASAPQAPVVQAVAPAPAPVVAPAPAPTPAPAPAPAPKAPSAPSGEANVSAPMPGTILDVLVKEGQSVNKGDVLVILEAMKMENEIMAADAGVVKAIYTSKGAAVNTGDPLLEIE